MDRLISLQAAINAINALHEKPNAWLDSAVDAVMVLPSADRPTDEEDQLKFYYVESIDDYWIGMRVDNFYYADWHEGLGFVWSHSRYLPWGEHIVSPNSLWKEHTYPSEPVEMPFTDWIVGFVKKYFADRPKGEWKIEYNGNGWNDYWDYTCPNCGKKYERADAVLYKAKFCPNCGSRMKGADDGRSKV